MPSLKNSRVVPYAIGDIYDIVIDIERYPQLLSFIRDVKILKRSDASLVARVQVGLPVLAFSYDCLVEFSKNQSIRITLVSGPFKRLNAFWEFTELQSAETRIDYSLDAEFKNPLAEITAGAIFASQLNHAIDVFTSSLRKS